MSRIAAIFALCFILSACVVYTPNNVEYTTVVHNETTSSVTIVTEKTITNEVSGRVVQKQHSSAQRLLADCEPFALPRDVQKPKELYPEDLMGPRTVEELDRLLMSKIKEYQTYVDSAHSKIEQAHQKWLETCQQKVPG